MIEDFQAEREEVKRLFSQKKYFKVILVGVQLLEKMADWLNECLDDMSDEMDMKMGESKHTSWKSVLKSYRDNVRSVRGEDAIRLKIIELIFDVCRSFYAGYTYKEANKLIHKTERVIAFRNTLAHNYFDEKENIKRWLKVRATECMDLVTQLENCPIPGF